jgi:hypothetical protein
MKKKMIAVFLFGVMTGLFAMLGWNQYHYKPVIHEMLDTLKTQQGILNDQQSLLRDQRAENDLLHDFIDNYLGIQTPQPKPRQTPNKKKGETIL